MKTVEIYIETSFKGPAVKDGKYASALVFTKSDGNRAERFLTGEEYETTYNRCTLMALIRALERLNQSYHVIVYMENAYVRNMIEAGNPEKWRRAEWQRAAGGKVQNRELWKLFQELAERHEITFSTSKHWGYREILKKEMAKET